VISKAGGDPALAAQCLDHLKQYLTLLSREGNTGEYGDTIPVS
jgi:hypothetical protein